MQKCVCILETYLTFFPNLALLMLNSAFRLRQITGAKRCAVQYLFDQSNRSLQQTNTAPYYIGQSQIFHYALTGCLPSYQSLHFHFNYHISGRPKIMMHPQIYSTIGQNSVATFYLRSCARDFFTVLCAIYASHLLSAFRSQHFFEIQNTLDAMDSTKCQELREINENIDQGFHCLVHYLYAFPC